MGQEDVFEQERRACRAREAFGRRCGRGGRPRGMARSRREVGLSALRQAPRKRWGGGHAVTPATLATPTKPGQPSAPRSVPARPLAQPWQRATAPKGDQGAHASDHRRLTCRQQDRTSLTRCSVSAGCSVTRGVRGHANVINHEQGPSQKPLAASPEAQVRHEPLPTERQKRAETAIAG